MNNKVIRRRVELGQDVNARIYKKKDEKENICSAEKKKYGKKGGSYKGMKGRTRKKDRDKGRDIPHFVQYTQ